MERNYLTFLMDHPVSGSYTLFNVSDTEMKNYYSVNISIPKKAWDKNIPDQPYRVFKQKTNIK